MSSIARHIKSKLLAALQANPVVFLNGPPQAGKSTLVKHIVQQEFPADYVTFDNTRAMAAATKAPEAYLRDYQNGLIIEKAQLVPEIFPALKRVVDELRQTHEGQANGRFLLTGSANILAFPRLSHCLVGRMDWLTLYPIASAEIAQGRGDFIERLFAGNFLPDDGQYELTTMIRAATFPEISGVAPAVSRHWFDGYLKEILQHDARALTGIAKLSALSSLLRILASRVGSFINDMMIAKDANLDPLTTQKYHNLLNTLFLTFDLTPLYRKIGRRLIKSTKVYIIDTLFLCHLLQYDLEALEKSKSELFGHLVENFVATELIKLKANSAQNLRLQPFRGSDNKMVHFVLKKTNGQIAGINVKKRDRIKETDFHGLQELQQQAGNDFTHGVILYRGKEIVHFSENLWAIPISNLWG